QHCHTCHGLRDNGKRAHCILIATIGVPARTSPLCASMAMSARQFRHSDIGTSHFAEYDAVDMLIHFRLLNIFSCDRNRWDLTNALSAWSCLSTEVNRIDQS